MTKEKLEFTLDRHAISMLIEAQAGSLQKAILEAVANALDAKSSKVKIKLDANRVVIEDDGHGFRNVDEIKSFFGRFGFDHSQLDRKVGRFGVGRGQLFHFGKNHWTTNEFTLDVDTRTDTFGYELGQAKKPYKGVKIEIDLYKPMSFNELATVESELKKLVRFSAIPVILNGKQVQKNPQDMKWDAETEDAWFKLDDSYEIKVYSQGLFVQGLPSRHNGGKGGIVVTKMGKALKQNMARNDMLVTDCPVWKRVNKTLKALARKHGNEARRGTNMNESMRAALALQGINGSERDDLDTLCNTPIFTLSNGRHIKLSTLVGANHIAVAQNKDPTADVLMQRKQALAINEQTLHRFRAENGKELEKALRRAFERYKPLYEHAWGDTAQTARCIAERLKSISIVNSVDELPMKADLALVEVQDREATNEERLALTLLRRNILPTLTHMVWNYLHPEQPKTRWHFDTKTVRKVQLATGNAMLACTDGCSKIWVDRQYLRDCIKQGPGGFCSLANTMLHELLHDKNSATGHDHDHDFFQAYHDLTLDGSVSNAGLYAYRTWLTRGGKATTYAVKEMEGAQMLDANDANQRLAALSNPQETQAKLDAEIAADAGNDGQEQPPAPAKRRRKMR